MCILTRKSLRSNLVKSEVKYAVSKNKLLLPFNIQTARIGRMIRIFENAKSTSFFRRKAENIGFKVLSIVQLSQSNLGIHKESIEEARIGLEKFIELQKIPDKKSLLKRFDTFRKVTIETLIKLGYSIKEKPMFYSRKNYVKKLHTIIATRNGKKIGIICYRKLKINEIVLAAKFFKKLNIDETWLVVPAIPNKIRRIAEDNGFEVIYLKYLLKELPHSEKEKYMQKFIQTETAQVDSSVIKEHYEELKSALKRAYSAKTSTEKGKSLEELAECFVNLFKGLSVIGRNVRIEAEELDLIVRNENEKIFWQRLGAPIIVECKNWTKKVGSDEIRNLVMKMRELRTAFLIAANGITQKGGAAVEIMEARKNMKYVLVFDISDFEEIISKGTNPEEIVKDKFYSLWMTQ